MEEQIKAVAGPRNQHNTEENQHTSPPPGGLFLCSTRYKPVPPKPAESLALSCIAGDSVQHPCNTTRADVSNSFNVGKSLINLAYATSHPGPTAPTRRIG